jgi:ClpP class serine protease
VAALVLSFGAFAEESKAKAPAKPDKAAEPAKKTVTLAHIKLSGGFDEKAPTVDPLLGQLGETFKQKIDRLKKARDDKDIQAVLLEINGAGLGQAARADSRHRLGAFRGQEGLRPHRKW